MHREWKLIYTNIRNKRALHTRLRYAMVRDDECIYYKQRTEELIEDVLELAREEHADIVELRYRRTYDTDNDCASFAVDKLVGNMQNIRTLLEANNANYIELTLVVGNVHA